MQFLYVSTRYMSIVVILSCFIYKLVLYCKVNVLTSLVVPYRKVNWELACPAFFGSVITDKSESTQILLLSCLWNNMTGKLIKDGSSIRCVSCGARSLEKYTTDGGWRLGKYAPGGNIYKHVSNCSSPKFKQNHFRENHIEGLKSCQHDIYVLCCWDICGG